MPKTTIGISTDMSPYDTNGGKRKSKGSPPQAGSGSGDMDQGPPPKRKRIANRNHNKAGAADRTLWPAYFDEVCRRVNVWDSLLRPLFPDSCTRCVDNLLWRMADFIS